MTPRLTPGQMPLPFHAEQADRKPIRRRRNPGPEAGGEPHAELDLGTVVRVPRRQRKSVPRWPPPVATMQIGDGPEVVWKPPRRTDRQR